MNETDTMLALNVPQMTTLLIAGGSVIALIILVLIYKAMSRPVVGYHTPAVPDHNPMPAPHSEAVEVAPRVDKIQGATKGFVLPPPSDAPAPTGFAPFVPSENAKSEPPAVPRSVPEPPAVPDVERTVDISNAKGANNAFDIPKSKSPADVTYRSLLIVRSGSRVGEAFQLDDFAGGLCAIGRSDVAENQIVIRDDLKVSRVQHAIVAREASGRYSIRDNNSANKVYVNDACIDAAPVPLSNGDRIRIGLTEFEYAVEPNA